MKWFWLILALIVITGCNPVDKFAAQTNTPEYVSAEFFRAIYNDKDLEKAKKLSTAEFAALMESYGTARQVGRSLFNMSFDSVNIVVNRTGQNLRQQYDNQANITLLFSGPHHGKRYDDVRVVELVKHQGRWLVKNVQQDKFSTTRT